ncbi:MAG: hypothetical protein ACX93P_10550 [Roseovarius sp.]
MTRTKLPAAVLSLSLAAVAPQSAVTQERLDRDEVRGAIAVIIALGVGVTIARHGDDHDLNSDWDQQTYGEPFSPGPNVVCLPQPRQCFERSHYSARWTRRIFGS